MILQGRPEELLSGIRGALEDLGYMAEPLTAQGLHLIPPLERREWASQPKEHRYIKAFDDLEIGAIPLTDQGTRIAFRGPVNVSTGRTACLCLFSFLCLVCVVGVKVLPDVVGDFWLTGKLLSAVLLLGVVFGTPLLAFYLYQWYLKKKAVNALSAFLEDHWESTGGT